MYSVAALHQPSTRQHMLLHALPSCSLPGRLLAKKALQALRFLPVERVPDVVVQLRARQFRLGRLSAGLHRAKEVRA